MNHYTKLFPNVYVAKCTGMHEKGDVIILTTKYGKEHECTVFNILKKDDSFFYYSIVRTDGFNFQEYTKKKAERLQSWALSAEKKSDKYYEASNEGKEFLVLAEPIKIGHHSEKRHRALIERNWNRMGKSIEFSKQAAQYESRADYWLRKSNEINLSMPESLEMWEYKLEEAKEKHEGLKSGKYPREHSYSLTYAKKAVNEAEKNLKIAKLLWS
jgi:hypothetical protein